MKNNFLNQLICSYSFLIITQVLLIAQNNWFCHWLILTLTIVYQLEYFYFNKSKIRLINTNEIIEYSFTQSRNTFDVMSLINEIEYSLKTLWRKSWSTDCRDVIKICLTDIINPKNDKREAEMTGDGYPNAVLKSISSDIYRSERNAVQKRGD